MDQDRRDAAAWAKEWQIKRKNRRLLYVVAAIALVAAVSFLIKFVIVQAERSTFSSEAEMKEAMQGRYARDGDLHDYVIEGDKLIETYLPYSHYDREYAETFGYDPDEKESVYEDRVVEWDYRHGVIKTEIMGDYIVDKEGNIRWGESSFYYTFYKTDKPRPEPIDPATLEHPEGGADNELSPEKEEAIEEMEESQQETEEAVEQAAPEETVPEGEEDVQA